ncbi:YhjD/YihY/BrkB family envelope integrity protein [Brevibacterium luteolum]|uniref:tRNA-processing ribonuclease n=1 Tax=Brevibacterium luteolum TaxID=199591 RepID=A0A6G8KUR6_9MICO|nr:YhjD/YihY/BrkB family envelope integrity protein [Brevibacterium luteolum]QIN28250.1 tRNA-processing ribonuclease [Brevibacterium luteolum]
MEPDNRILVSSSSAAASAQSFMNKPAVAHLMATLQRFGQRLGSQFGAAITYFLVLALIPTLMFAFAALGFILDIVRPELVDVVTQKLHEFAPGQDQLVEMLQNFIDNWQAVGIVGIISALYTAQGFIGNLKDAIRAQLRKDMDAKPQENFVVRTLSNIVTLIGLLIGVGLTIGLTVIGTGLQTTIVEWLQLPGWVTPVLTITPIIITLFSSWLIFMFLFTMIPIHPIQPRTKRLGSLFGAIALTLLLNIATVLIDLFSGSPTAALFGPVIAIMLSMNVFARIILMVAAWMGTADDEPIFGTIAEAPPASREQLSRAQGGAETIGALAVAGSLIAVTILGFNRWADKHDTFR